MQNETNSIFLFFLSSFLSLFLRNEFTDNDILVSEQPITTTETDTNFEEIVNEDG